jgi:hypothetical protein
MSWNEGEYLSQILAEQDKAEKDRAEREMEAGRGDKRV